MIFKSSIPAESIFDEKPYEVEKTIDQVIVIVGI